MWLVKPKDKNKVLPGRKNLVYALKILRKADGEFTMIDEVVQHDANYPYSNKTETSRTYT